MYSKNKGVLERMLKEFKAGIVGVADMVQGIQNIIGEEVERKDLKDDKYEVDDE